MKKKIRNPYYEPRNVGDTIRSKILGDLNAGLTLSTFMLKSIYGAKNPTATMSGLKNMGWKIERIGRRYSIAERQLDIKPRYWKAA